MVKNEDVLVTQHGEEEVDLIEVFQILCKRKKVIVIGALLVAFVASVASFSFTEVYRATVILGAPTQLIQNKKGLEKAIAIVAPETIKELVIAGVFNAQIQKELNISDENFPKFKVVLPYKTSLIKLTVKTGDPQQAISILDEMVAQVLKFIKYEMGNRVNLIEVKIELSQSKKRSVINKIELIKRHITETGDGIVELDKLWLKLQNEFVEDESSVFLHLSEIQDKRTYLYELLERLSDLEIDIQKLDVSIEKNSSLLKSMSDAKVHKAPLLSGKISKQMQTIVVGAVSFFISMVFLIFLVLFQEFFKRLKASGRLNEVH